MLMSSTFLKLKIAIGAPEKEFNYLIEAFVVGHHLMVLDEVQSSCFGSDTSARSTAVFAYAALPERGLAASLFHTRFYRSFVN
jgi:hypothetical protein